MIGTKVIARSQLALCAGLLATLPDTGCGGLANTGDSTSADMNPTIGPNSSMDGSNEEPQSVPDASDGSAAFMNDVSVVKDVSQEQTGPVTCDGKTCGENQYCVHQCCGICRSPYDGGTCPSGFELSLNCNTPGVAQCACIPARPHCVDAPGVIVPQGSQGSVQQSPTLCQEICNGPRLCDLYAPGNIGCTCG
jgi:hypothetical protein